MIVKEFYGIRKDGRNLVRTFSNEGMKIQKIGTEEVYDEAIDLDGMPFEYREITEEEYNKILEETEGDIK